MHPFFFRILHIRFVLTNSRSGWCPPPISILHGLDFVHPGVSHTLPANVKFTSGKPLAWLQNFALALDPLGRFARLFRFASRDNGNLAVRKVDSIPSVMCRSGNFLEKEFCHIGVLCCHNILSLRDLPYPVHLGRGIQTMDFSQRINLKLWTKTRLQTT